MGEHLMQNKWKNFWKAASGHASTSFLLMVDMTPENVSTQSSILEPHQAFQSDGMRQPGTVGAPAGKEQSVHNNKIIPNGTNKWIIECDAWSNRFFQDWNDDSVSIYSVSKNSVDWRRHGWEQSSGMYLFIRGENYYTKRFFTKCL